MKIIAKSLIALWLVALSSIAGSAYDHSQVSPYDGRVYQAQSTDDDDAEQDSTGTPTDLILDTEPEC